ncbi:hypothetical protein IEO21_07246 [Rhodonia placenta]|uniref:Uncharacterized protein n=1 Tax=Rhodonia placenta TaxID=104341 RepID=A0A8H7NYW1_9APHY|nr:hypothetical protein IEO21_07246 [Postia placenta]
MAQMAKVEVSITTLFLRDGTVFWWLYLNLKYVFANGTSTFQDSEVSSVQFASNVIGPLGGSINFASSFSARTAIIRLRHVARPSGSRAQHCRRNVPFISLWAARTDEANRAPESGHASLVKPASGTGIRKALHASRDDHPAQMVDAEAENVTRTMIETQRVPVTSVWRLVSEKDTEATFGVSVEETGPSVHPYEGDERKSDVGGSAVGECGTD